MFGYSVARRLGVIARDYIISAGVLKNSPWLPHKVTGIRPIKRYVYDVVHAFVEHIRSNNKSVILSVFLIADMCTVVNIFRINWNATRLPVPLFSPPPPFPAPFVWNCAGNFFDYPCTFSSLLPIR